MTLVHGHTVQHTVYNYTVMLHLILLWHVVIHLACQDQYNYKQEAEMWLSQHDKQEHESPYNVQGSITHGCKLMSSHLLNNGFFCSNTKPQHSVQFVSFEC